MATLLRSNHPQQVEGVEMAGLRFEDCFVTRRGFVEFTLLMQGKSRDEPVREVKLTIRRGGRERLPGTGRDHRQFGCHALEHFAPLTALALPEQPRGRVPGRILA